MEERRRAATEKLKGAKRRDRQRQTDRQTIWDFKVTFLRPPVTPQLPAAQLSAHELYGNRGAHNTVALNKHSSRAACSAEG